MPIGGGISMSQDFYNQPQELIPQARNVLGLPATTPIGAPASTSPGTITGTAPSTYNPAVGGIPSVPDPLKAIQEAITGYTTNYNALQALANQQTAANQAAALKQITDLYPQFKGNTAQLGADIADWASGRISGSTVNELTRRMGERGIAGGFGPNAPATNAALMSLLGKTSEGLQQAGLTGQNTLLAGLPRTAPTSVESFGLTPGNIFGNLYNAQLQAALYRAAPDPASAYNLAMSNALKGLGAGGAAGRGPYAGTPTTGSTSSPEILKLLQDLINRGSGTSTGSQTSAYYAQPSAATYDTTPYTDYFTEQDPYYSDLFTPDTSTPVTDNVPYTDYFGPQDPYFQDLFQG